MAFSTRDTIVAIASPPGRGGIGVVRISGTEARRVAEAVLDRRLARARFATLARVVRRAAGAAGQGGGRLQGAGSNEASGGSGAVDEVLATRFAAPASYTGEDVVEVSAHGSPYVLEEIVRLAVRAGARVAEPGEFTLRAFLNGRLDLVQAEAVADLVDSVTPLQARAAFDQLQGTLTARISEIESELFELVAGLEASIDYPEESYHFLDANRSKDQVSKIGAALRRLRLEGERGRAVREGRQVVIIGPTNVGKSSIFNALAGSARAIVTPVPGTTRDMLVEVVDIEGLRVTVVDTAGLRPPSDEVEAEGVKRAERATEVADLVLVVEDASAGAGQMEEWRLPASKQKARLLVLNKIDLLGEDSGVGEDGGARRGEAVRVSAKTGAGLDVLRKAIASALRGGEPAEVPALTNIRQLELVARAEGAVDRAAAALASDPPLAEEFVVADLNEARMALEEVSGKRSTEEMLAHIFERFCVGK